HGDPTPWSAPGAGRALLRRVAGVRLLAEVPPARLGDLDVVVLRRPLDVRPGLVAIRVADVLHLVEAGERVADVARVGERLLALLGERERRVGQVVALAARELAVRCVGLPGGRGHAVTSGRWRSAGPLPASPGRETPRGYRRVVAHAAPQIRAATPEDVD